MYTRMHTEHIYHPTLASSILVVEPIKDTRKKIGNAFFYAGIECTTVATGQDALAFVQRVGVPKLAIIDLTLPDMSGRELTTCLHQIKHFPVIMTAYQAEPHVIAELLDSLVDDFLRKPFDVRELVARACRFLFKHPNLRQSNTLSDEQRIRLPDYSRGHFRLVYQ